MARLFALTERFEEAILIYEELGRWLLHTCKNLCNILAHFTILFDYKVNNNENS
jgi:hypothetical protein